MFPSATTANSRVPSFSSSRNTSDLVNQWPTRLLHLADKFDGVIQVIALLQHFLNTSMRFVGFPGYLPQCEGSMGHDVFTFVLHQRPYPVLNLCSLGAEVGDTQQCSLLFDLQKCIEIVSQELGRVRLIRRSDRP